MSASDPPKSPPPASATQPPPPGSWYPFVRMTEKAAEPLDRFLRIEAASGIVLMLAAAAALFWANSPWADTYGHFWHTTLGVRIGDFAFERSLEWLVNDVLMVIFFFVVGMEIHREIDHGELSDRRRAALPAAAALGGMLVPAALYLAIAGDPATRSGWGVPMATDIAFALGILALLGKRVPDSLRMLLLALAVIDDLGAILVIALFYTEGVQWMGLVVAALGMLSIVVLQWSGVRRRLPYFPPSFVTWAGIYMAGIHPTIAGVMIGMITPVRAWFGREGFIEGLRRELQRLQQDDDADGPPKQKKLEHARREVDFAGREAVSPTDSLLETLHPWVAFGIMPVFALANAGVALGGADTDAASLAVTGGVVAGLLLGKPLGVIGACWLALRFGVASLPAGLDYRHLAVLGIVAGIGFTMSLFIAMLAFTDANLLASAKLGVLVASGAAAIGGVGLGWMTLKSRPASS